MQTLSLINISMNVDMNICIYTYIFVHKYVYKYSSNMQELQVNKYEYVY